MNKESQRTVLSNFGIELIGEVPWGTHLCQFYESKQDLIDVLVPYFAEGLRSNEFCMWVTSPPLEVAEAKKALRTAVPDLDKYLLKGQIEIVSYNDWYLLGGKFDCNRVLQGWVEKENAALKNGFEGLRLTGNTFWIERDLWKSFVDYEAAVNAVIGNHNMIALCTYCLLSCTGTDVVDVVRNHVGTLIKQSGTWVLVEDALQRKKIEEALRKSEVLKRSSLYARTLIEASPDPLVTINAEGKITDVNKATELATGYSREKMIGSDFSNYFTEPKKAREGYKHVFTDGSVKDYPLAIRHKSGKITYVLYNATVYRDEAGEIQGVFAAARDITERKKAEAALRAEREHLFGVLESLPVMVCLLTEDHHVAFSNRLFEQRFGESKGRRCFEFLFGLNQPCEWCEAYNVLKTGQPHYWRLNCPDGSIFDVYNSPFRDADGSPMILEVDVDVTARIKLEKQLKDSERLAAIGATAGMVGHDIRNPLQSIISDAYLAKLGLASIPGYGKEREELDESLQNIERNVDYINKIVQDLQDYARPLTLVPQETDFEGLCQEILFKNGVPKNISTFLQVEGQAKKLIADPALLKRIMSNLVNNAVQAMPHGGKLAITALKDAESIVITVQDTGVGVPTEVQSKLFTPLFTTKSKGQGFGLAVVKRMTEALNGAVTFESQEGKGTKFVVRLPSKS